MQSPQCVDREPGHPVLHHGNLALSLEMLTPGRKRGKEGDRQRERGRTFRFRQLKLPSGKHRQRESPPPDPVDHVTLPNDAQPSTEHTRSSLLCPVIARLPIRTRQQSLSSGGFRSAPAPWLSRSPARSPDRDQDIQRGNSNPEKWFVRRG